MKVFNLSVKPPRIAITCIIQPKNATNFKIKLIPILNDNKILVLGRQLSVTLHLQSLKV